MLCTSGDHRLHYRHPHCTSCRPPVTPPPLSLKLTAPFTHRQCSFTSDLLPSMQPPSPGDPFSSGDTSFLGFPRGPRHITTSSADTPTSDILPHSSQPQYYHTCQSSFRTTRKPNHTTTSSFSANHILPCVNLYCTDTLLAGR